MKNFKLLFLLVCAMFCFSTVQAQFFTNGGSIVWTNDNVGINTNTPAFDLDVDGNVRVQSGHRLELQGTTDATGSNNSGVLEIGNNLRLDNNEIITNTNSILYLNHNNNGDVRVDNGTLSVDASTNRVGVGTTAPAYKLDVNGDLRVRGNDIFGSTSSSGNLRIRAVGGGYIDLRPNDASFGLIVREYNSTDYGNIEVTASGLGLGYRTSGAHLMISTAGNIGLGLTNPQVKLDVNGDITTSSAHRRGKIRLWKEASAADANVSHAFGTEAFYNTYGPGTNYANTVGHKMYVHGNELAARIGIGGGGTPATRLNSQFFGDVTIGSIETFSDEGGFIMGVNSHFSSTNDCLDNLGRSTNRWNNVYYCGSLISSSDRNLKSNIKDMDYGLAEIMEMRPVSYTYKAQEDEGTKLGLIAQDLQPIVSEVVKSEETFRNEDGKKVTKASAHLGVDYVALIPVLIKGMQEQQVLIEEQQARIDQLEAQMSNGAPTQEGTETAPSNDLRINAQPTGKIFQNNPNPFKNTTMISYELPENMTQARLVVTDMLGIQVANYNLAANQKTGQVTVNADDLANGTYVYTLIVDGTTVASNKMIVAK